MSDARACLTRQAAPLKRRTGAEETEVAATRYEEPERTFEKCAEATERLNDAVNPSERKRGDEPCEIERRTGAEETRLAEATERYIT